MTFSCSFIFPFSSLLCLSTSPSTTTYLFCSFFVFLLLLCSSPLIYDCSICHPLSSSLPSTFALSCSFLFFLHANFFLSSSLFFFFIFSFLSHLSFPLPFLHFFLLLLCLPLLFPSLPPPFILFLIAPTTTPP